MTKRLSLREFQEDLVKRFAEAQSGNRRALLGVRAGRENWLINLTDSGEILPAPPLAPVPLTHDWFRGLANVRGTLFSVVDFSAFHDGPLTPPGGSARLLLVGARHGTNCALLISSALGLRNPDDFHVDPDGGADDRPWVAERLLDTRDQHWLRLDVPTLLAQRGFLQAGLE
ncbi:chemotaxis protein CheW [Aromatoleum evansii]|uniref:Chemotaxis protein CheW n=1 Tax=Aromatoleum evansii TaxID=59406 RepID=A0ABZ1AIQ7_AROEV|nr:chemotaxis protein CheW [Aromatoleum evansii]NMG29193.1 chemotaxis protein CheW [Aromatoleum evansii]WRL45753.1 chemotaxis protein CheW [Aromatoleum evansii]